MYVSYSPPVTSPICIYPIIVLPSYHILKDDARTSGSLRRPKLPVRNRVSNK